MDKHEIKRVTFHDLMGYRFLSAPRFSPDGTKIAFAVHQCSLEENSYRSCLWLYDLDADRPLQLTHSGREGAFCWSVNGDEIFFISDRPSQDKKNKSEEEKNKKEKGSRLYALPLGGGEARLLCELPRTVSGLWDTPCGILLLTTAPRELERLEDADYKIFTQIPFCSNGKGYTARQRLTLSLLAFPTLPTAESPLNSFEPVDLTPETMNVNQVRLSEDRRHAFITAVDYDGVMPVTSGVWEIDLDTKTVTSRLPQGQFFWACAAPFGPENKNKKELLLTGTDMKHYGLNENVSFFVLSGSDNGGEDKLKCLTPELDSSLNNTVICDCRYGGGLAGESFISEGDRAYFVSTEGCRANLYSLDGQGLVTQVSHTLRSVDGFDIKGSRAALVGMEGLSLQELYILDLNNLNDLNNKNLTERRLTDFNTAILEGADLSVPEHVRLENGTPEGLDCWYMRPVGFEVGRKYPAVLHVHGGPKCAFGDIFVHEMQCWAAEGFAVLFCNPRGSDGRGNAFADIRGRYGTVDYEDLMTFTDWAVKTLPFVDGDRLGVTGGSYGGFMTNWIVGHTNRFRAAVTQRSICNWISMVGMSDIGYYFVADQQAADVNDNIEALWERSPLKYAAQVVTPTLLIHSDEDHRCELGQGLQFFTALKRNGVETKLCVFEGENHELSRSGKPRARLARLEEIARWLQERL